MTDGMARGPSPTTTRRDDGFVDGVKGREKDFPPTGSLNNVLPVLKVSTLQFNRSFSTGQPQGVSNGHPHRSKKIVF